jgi:hypothetical protein
MWPLGGESMILAMTRQAATSKVMLLEDRRAGAAPTGSAPVRRYRIARVRPGSTPSQTDKRFDYLKRTFD